MGLSNTATPKFYGMFREDVLNGNVPVNRLISLEMNRIDSLIENPSFYYDDKALDGYIKFCENELVLTDGSDMKLLFTFKLWAEQLLSWFYFVEKSVYVPGKNNHGGRYEKKVIKKRLTNKQFIITSRGSSKSMYNSTIHAFELTVNTNTSHQVTTAPVMKQAEEVMSPIRTAIVRSRGPLFKFMTNGSLQNTTGSKVNRIKLSSTKKGIENFLTNSLLEVRPMSIDKLQGLRPKITTVDEWLSVDIREDPIGAIEQGASKLDDYIIIATSSEGTVRNGSGDTIKMELMDILNNKYINPHVSIWWYRLDDIHEINDPEMWIKACPNIGITVSHEIYQSDVERAKNNPSARNDIIAKRFGIPLEGFTYFFTYEETLLYHKKLYFYGMPCSLGIDLSKGDDFCSFTFLFPIFEGVDVKFGIKTRNYITSNTLSKLPGALRSKYEEFINEGSLIIMEGIVLDLDAIYDDVDEFIIKSDYDVRCVGYDPYNAKIFIDRWIGENGPFGIEKVIQGSRTESVPLGEIKKLSEERKLLFDQIIMKYAMGNCITVEDTNGNRKLLKKRNDLKIDPVAAAMDAYISYKLNSDMFE